MKILWWNHVEIPRISKLEGKKSSTYVGGWLTGISDSILQYDNNELVILYPVFDKKTHIGQDGHFKYYGINVDSNSYNHGDKDLFSCAKVVQEIIKTEQPEVIHIHGTEFPLSLIVAEASQNLNMLSRTIVSIQGLTSVYAEHVYADIPDSIKYRKNLREIYRKTSLRDQFKDYSTRGDYEKKLLQMIPNAIGRTRWDMGCLYNVSPNIKYFHCNETLRKEFYEGKWTYEHCKKHSIFVSQGAKPIKGLHNLLIAAGSLKLKYPDIRIKVAGSNILNISSYGKYLRELLYRYQLSENVVFVGPLDAQQMKEQMLSSNVFVLPSAIENSPNSLGEAMILGTPCIASNVGGVPDLLTDRVDGLLYPYNETYMLQYYISQLFEKPEYASILGNSASMHANQTYDVENNYRTLMSIYNDISH